jgi:hypothetical protein
MKPSDTLEPKRGVVEATSVIPVATKRNEPDSVSDI